MSNFWKVLESVHGAVPGRWQAELGAEYEAVKLAFLRATGTKAKEYPCPHECGCWHEIIEHAENDIVGVCRCDPEESNCNNLTLSAPEIEYFDLNTAKLGRAVARAFGCDAKEVDMGLPRTWQVGAFSGAAMPVVLTMQDRREEFKSVVAQLICKLSERFILLAPTSRLVDANSLALFASGNVGFFDLASNLELSGDGVLQARRSGGELFTKYLPEKQAEVQISEAEKVIAIVSKLRSEQGKQKAALFDLFNLLVVDGFSQKQAAAACCCTPGLISIRVRELEERFGLPVEQLRAFASDVRERSSSVKGDEFRGKHDGARGDESDEGGEEN